MQLLGGVNLSSPHLNLLVYVCSPGSCGNCRPEEDPRRSSALHHPQHHRAGQALPDVPRPRPGRPAGRAGQPSPAAEHPQPERGAGHWPEGRREAGEEEEEEAEQSQPSELPEEEEERPPDTAAEEDRRGREEEEKPTQEAKRQHISSRGYKYIE